MLQQTRVAAVLDHYARWMRRFPTVHELAKAREQTVLALWSGLGYYHRARRLHQAARIIARERNGEFPRTAEVWRELPGIGRYTAAAIASIAFGESVAVVDGNVERVLERVFGRADKRERNWQRAEALLDRARPGDFNQAMMELGATICTPRAPAMPYLSAVQVVPIARSRCFQTTAATKSPASSLCILGNRRQIRCCLFSARRTQSAWPACGSFPKLHPRRTKGPWPNSAIPSPTRITSIGCSGVSQNWCRPSMAPLAGSPEGSGRSWHLRDLPARCCASWRLSRSRVHGNPMNSKYCGGILDGCTGNWNLAPDFTLPTLEGQKVSLKQLLQHGPVVLAFFKVSCPVCQYAFPLYERLSQANKGQTPPSSACRRTACTTPTSASTA